MGKWKTYSDGESIPTDDATSYEDVNHWLDYRDYSDDTHASGWGASEKGRLWWNTTDLRYKFWDGSTVQTLPGTASDIPFITISPTESALKSAISTYGGKKIIVIPQDDTGFTIDEKIAITTERSMIVNYPYRSCPITLTADGYFSIESASDLDYGRFVFDGLNVDGDTAATRAISTENMGTGKRARYLKVSNNRFSNFDAASAVVIQGKNPELWEICGNHMSSNKSALIHLYEDGYSAGNVWIYNNFMYPFSGANNGVGVKVTQVTAGKTVGAVQSYRNHYYGGSSGSSNNCLAFQIVNTTDNANITSDADRFENIKVFSPSVTAGDVVGLRIVNSPSIYYAKAFDVELIELTSDCLACQVVNNWFQRGGANNITGVRDENTGTNYNVNRVGGNVFRYWDDGASGSTYLTQAGGATTVEDPANQHA